MSSAKSQFLFETLANIHNSGKAATNLTDVMHAPILTSPAQLHSVMLIKINYSCTRKGAKGIDSGLQNKGNIRNFSSSNTLSSHVTFCPMTVKQISCLWMREGREDKV